MADDSDDDPVVDEIDVFLSKSLSENLYLIQYPLRPKGMSYNHLDHMSARVKPVQKRVEIELALNTRSKNYSSSKGEQIAVNVDGNLPPGAADKYFTGSKMDKINLTSPPQSKSFSHCQYAIGLYKDEELHLTPLNAVVQLRPSFDYLDKADTRHRNEAENTSFGDGGESSQDEAEEEATPVTMKVSRGESEEFKARRMASYEYVNQKREEERWIPVKFYNAESGVSEAERQQLQAGDAPHVSQFKISPQEYLQSLIPPSTEDKSEKPAMPDNVLSLNELRKLELNDQIKALLINVKVIRFSQLLSFLAPGTDHTAILRSLQNMAVLVQGCWVVKSELLYPNEEKEDLARKKKSHSAVSHELLRRVRDYAMWKFTHNKYVVRKDISSIVQLPSDDVKEILERMSKLKARSGWEFLYDYDRDFCERHPDIVQRQRNKWALTFQTLAQHFKMPKDGEKKALEQEMALMNQQPAERHRTRRLSSRSPRKRTLSGRSQSDLSDMELDSSNDRSGRRPSVSSDSHRNRSGSLSKSDRDVSLNGSVTPQHSSSFLASVSTPTLLHNGINSAGDTSRYLTSVDNSATGMNSSPVNTNNLSPEIMLELEHLLKEALSTCPVLSMSDIRNKISIYAARVPSSHLVASGISDKVLEECIRVVGGYKLNNQWPIGRRPESLFSSNSGDDKYDKLRKILFSIFEESPKLRSGTFKTRVKNEGLELSEAEAKKFLKDHCEVSFATWYLKGALPPPSDPKS